MGRLAILVLVMAVAWAATARATTIGVLRAGRPPSVTSEAMIRVVAELRALGLEPRMLDVPETVLSGSRGRGGPPSYLQSVAVEQGVDGVIALPGAPTPTAVEVWAADGKGRSVARRLSIDPSARQAPQTIAIRAIELLRSCLLEIDLLAGAPVVTADVARPPALALDERSAPAEAAALPRFGVAVGALAMFTTDGVGPAVLPFLHADWQLTPIWFVRAALAGEGTRGLVEGQDGTARVGEDEILLGVGYAPFSKRLRPVFALSAGALRTAVEGRAQAGYESHQLARWSFLVDGAAGLGLRLGARWELTAAAHLQAALPAPTIRFVGQDVATAAYPNILLGLTAEVWL